MKKLKDLCLLFFWGTIAGAFFVGCIVGFGHLWNRFARTAITQLPLAKEIFITLLSGVIIGAIYLIARIWTKCTKSNWDENKKLLEKFIQKQ